MEAALLAACPLAAQKDQEIFEVSTEMTYEVIDQGVIDYFYTSIFEVHAMDEDGYHPRPYKIQVNSAWYSGANPTPYDYIQIAPIQGCR